MSYPTDMNDLQYDLRKWTEKQFTTRDMNSILRHLEKEILELEAEPKDIMEFADCFMLLLDAASFQDIYMSDIWRAIGEKLEINKKRKWGKPNADGFVEHVKHTDKPDTPSGDTKELVVALDWVLSDYEGMCTEGFPPSANWNRRVDSARKAIQALQPQGDKQ